MSNRSAFLRQWGAPMALSFLTLLGLLFALVSDAGWDVASWLALIIPLLVILVVLFSLRSKERGN